MLSAAAFGRDANSVPITSLGLLVSKAIITNATNTTTTVPLFSVTGTIKVSALYGIVTTTLGSNQTAAYWQINDQTSTPDISLASGTTMSSAGIGSLLLRNSVAGVALVLANSSAGRGTDPVAATAPDVFMPFTVTQKVGGILTTIDYTYTTNQSPTTGAITFY